jgi:hypothetical protein
MLDKLKGIGGQLGQAVGGVASTVKEGAGTVAQAATGAARTAGQAVGVLNDKVNEVTTRESIVRLRETLAIAVEELRRQPVSHRPVTLVAKVDLVVSSLEIQMVFDPADPAPPQAGPVVVRPAVTPTTSARTGSTAEDPPAG